MGWRALKPPFPGSLRAAPLSEERRRSSTHLAPALSFLRRKTRRRSFGRRLTTPAAAARAADIINELSPDFTAVHPSQATSDCVPGRECDAELSGNVVILNDELHAALRQFRDCAVARQRTVILNLREALFELFAFASIQLAFSSIQQHFDHRSPRAAIAPTELIREQV
jgi:hypothetical protein